MRNVPLNARRGFTLIELLVSISIIGLLLAAGVPAFRSYGARVALDGAAESVTQALYQARTLVLAPEADKAPDVLAYGLVFDQATGQYHVTRFAEDQSTDCVFTPLSVVRTLNLSAGLRFASTPEAIVFPIDAQGQPALCEAMIVSLEHTGLRRDNRRVVAVQPVSGQVTITEGVVE